MGQNIPRNLPVQVGSVISSPAFGLSRVDETVGQFIDRTISYCKDNRLVWRAKFSRVCGKRVDRWIIVDLLGVRKIKCPHCEATAYFNIVSKDSE